MTKTKSDSINPAGLMRHRPLVEEPAFGVPNKDPVAAVKLFVPVEPNWGGGAFGCTVRDEPNGGAVVSPDAENGEALFEPVTVDDVTDAGVPDFGNPAAEGKGPTAPSAGR